MCDSGAIGTLMHTGLEKATPTVPGIDPETFSFSELAAAKKLDIISTAYCSLQKTGLERLAEDTEALARLDYLMTADMQNATVRSEVLDFLQTDQLDLFMSEEAIVALRSGGELLASSVWVSVGHCLRECLLGHWHAATKTGAALGILSEAGLIRSPTFSCNLNFGGCKRSLQCLLDDYCWCIQGALYAQPLQELRDRLLSLITSLFSSMCLEVNVLNFSGQRLPQSALTLSTQVRLTLRPVFFSRRTYLSLAVRWCRLATNTYDWM